MWANTGDLTLRYRIPAEFAAVRACLGSLCRALSADGLSTEEVGTVEIVLAEALNNIVEHAYCAADDGMIELSVQRMPSGCHFTIRDTGRAMPGNTPPLGISADPSLGSRLVPEGGYGWFMIRELAHDVDYRRAGDTNRLTFRLGVGKTLVM